LYEIYGGVEFSMENAQIVASIVEYRGAGRGGAGPEGEGKGLGLIRPSLAPTLFF